MELVIAYPNEPCEFDYMSIEGHGLDYVKMHLVYNLPPSIVNDKPYAFDKVYLSDYCRLT